MESLIEKYLLGELSENEEAELNEWLRKDPVNRKVFENIVGQWRISDDEVVQAKERVYHKVKSVSPETKSSPHLWSYIIGIAAVLVVAVGLGLYFNPLVSNGNHQTIVEKEAMRGQKLSFKLPDGSTVTLNAASKIRYPENFAADRREVSLEGEAFFQVARNEAKPFRIQTSSLNVQVLGTSFDVKAYANDDHTTVAVKTGKVKVSKEVGPGNLILTPGQMISHESANNQWNKSQIVSEKMVFGWTENMLTFDNLSFPDIIKTLSRWYTVDFDIEDQLKLDKKFTANYRNPSLNEVLESLSYAYGFDYKIKDGRVIIKRRHDN